MANTFLKNYFGFNKQQRNGLLVLVLICLVLFFIRLMIPYIIVAKPITIKNLPVLEMKETNEKKRNYNGLREGKVEEMNQPVLFVFDPNKVSYDELLKLGLSEKTAKIFLKFRNKGFVFKHKSELLKVYGISDEMYENLEPYILIDYKTETKKSNEIETHENVKGLPAQKKQVELNSADSTLLLGVKGIGPVYAKRIIKYRSLLGGYYKVDQLMEVYGMSEANFTELKLELKADTTLIRKINLNTDDFKVINKHPYLSYEMTKKICDERRKNRITAQSLKNMLEDEMLYLKLRPYCAFD